MNNQEDWEYRLIDNNWTRHPVAFCWYRKAYLTKKLMKTHRCEQRKCKRLCWDLDKVDSGKSGD